MYFKQKTSLPWQEIRPLWQQWKHQTWAADCVASAFVLGQCSNSWCRDRRTKYHQTYSWQTYQPGCPTQSAEQEGRECQCLRLKWLIPLFSCSGSSCRSATPGRLIPYGTSHCSRPTCVACQTTDLPGICQQTTCCVSCPQHLLLLWLSLINNLVVSSVVVRGVEGRIGQMR